MMDLLPGAHANVLIYLMEFIRQIFAWPIFLQNPEVKRRIGMSFPHRIILMSVRAFSKVLVRSPTKSASEDLRRKEMVITRLLED